MSRRFLAPLFAIAIAALLCSGLASAQSTNPKKEEAQGHFDLGLSHFDREEWPAALVEFLKARELFPSRGNTKNAAICLRKMGRFDESLDMFQILLKDFPDLSVADKTLAQREVNELQASVGTVAIQGAPADATVTIDSVPRGKTPLPGPIRLSAGSHVVRVTKDGALPFEEKIDLAGRQAATVKVQLAALTQAGRLRVAEHDAKPADVVVDGAVVGKVPWEGALAPGSHTVFLRGEGDQGTAPVLATVRLDQVASLDLALKTLAAQLRVSPQPVAAAVAIDGVPVGDGAWEGKLDVGTHKVAVTLAGYEPFLRDVSLEAGAPVTLEAPLVSTAVATARSGIVLELVAGPALALSLGGDLSKDDELEQPPEQLVSSHA